MLLYKMPKSYYSGVSGDQDSDKTDLLCIRQWRSDEEQEGIKSG